MKKTTFLVACVAFLLLAPIKAFAYQLNGPSWPDATTTFHIDIPGSNGLWDQAFQEALDAWTNATNFTFSSTPNSFVDPCGSVNLNGEKFDSTFCGQSFGSSTLAVTQWWFNGGNDLTRAGIVFNSNWQWDVYSGPLQGGSVDFRRVAIHELGHALGLGHESSQPAIMAPTISSIDAPTADDIAGVNALYPNGGGGGGNPQPDPNPTPQNTAPQVSSTIPNITVAQNAPNETVDLYNVFEDAEDTDQEMTYTESHNNSGLFDSVSISNGVLTLNFAAGATGSANITVRATDTGGLYAEDTFSVTVTGGANEAPVVSSPIADYSVEQNAPTVMMDLYPVFDDDRDSDSALNYSVVGNTNSSLFSSVRIRRGRYLRLNYSSSGVGQSTITVRATDTGGLSVEDSFTVTVGTPPAADPTPENTPPTVEATLADVTVDQDAGDTNIGLFGAFQDAEDADSQLTYSVQGNTNPSLVSTSISGGTLTLSYAAGGSGNAQITVRATDTGDLFVEQTFDVTVTAADPAPDPAPGPSADTLHVGDLDGSWSAVFRNFLWTATVTVTVHSADETPVANAQVSGSWSRGSGSGSCTTNGGGTCTMQSGMLFRGNSVSYTVSNVSGAGLTYEASANHDPDGSSDGTTITISRSGAVRAGAETAGTTTLAVGLGSDAGGGQVALMDPGAQFAPLDPIATTLSDYQGETRPAWCDLDGDGSHELVIGFGKGSNGQLEVMDDVDGTFSHLTSLSIDWPVYTEANGETWPACGDIDGDGKDEIVVGLGKGGSGWVFVFDDAEADYAPFAGTPNGDGWLTLDWETYDARIGEVHPAVGNLDADDAEEIVLGLASGGRGSVQILDDAAAEFEPLAGTPEADGWLRLGWRTYERVNGELWPAVCDLNGDGSGEVVLGLGQGGRGMVRVFDSAAAFEPLADTPDGDGWVQLGWSEYNARVGAVYPTCGDVDGDGLDELLLGQAAFQPGGNVEVRDDAQAGLEGIGWAQIGDEDYNAADGTTRPALAR